MGFLILMFSSLTEVLFMKTIINLFLCITDVFRTAHVVLGQFHRDCSELLSDNGEGKLNFPFCNEKCTIKTITITLCRNTAWWHSEGLFCLDLPLSPTGHLGWPKFLVACGSFFQYYLQRNYFFKKAQENYEENSWSDKITYVKELCQWSLKKSAGVETVVFMVRSTRNTLFMICSWITASVFLPIEGGSSTRNLLLM